MWVGLAEVDKAGLLGMDGDIAQSKAMTSDELKPILQTDYLQVEKYHRGLSLTFAPNDLWDGRGGHKGVKRAKKDKSLAHLFEPRVLTAVLAQYDEQIKALKQKYPNFTPSASTRKRLARMVTSLQPLWRNLIIQQELHDAFQKAGFDLTQVYTHI